MDSASHRANMPPASSWTLEGDGKLLEYMQSIAKNLENRSNKTMKDINGMMLSVDVASVSLDNVGNKLQRLQQTQFIENRVQEEDVQLPVNHELTSSIEKPLLDDVEATKIVINDSLAMLNKCYKKISVEQEDDDDSDMEDESLRHVYKPINPYDKRTPYIIGTKEWLEKWHIGLQNDDDSDESDINDEPEREIIESSDEIEKETSPSSEEDVQPSPPVNHVHVPNMIATLPELLKTNQVLPVEPQKPPPAPEQSFFRNQPSLAPTIPTIPQHFTQNFFDDEPPELDNISVGNASTSRAAPNLFTESDEENENFIKSTPRKQSTIDEPDKLLPTTTTTTPVNKNTDKKFDNQLTNSDKVITPKSLSTSKVSNLFESDSDDDEDYFDIIRKSNSAVSKSAAVKIPEKNMSVNLVKADSPKIEEKTPAKVETVERIAKSVPPKKVSNLFEDSDDDDDDFMKPVPPKSVLTKSQGEEPKAETTKKSDLFGNISIKEIPKFASAMKSTPKKMEKSLFDNSDDEDALATPLPKSEPKKVEKTVEFSDPLVVEPKNEEKIVEKPPVEIIKVEIMPDIIPEVRKTSFLEARKVEEKPKAFPEVFKSPFMEAKKMEEKPEIVPEVPKPAPMETKMVEEKQKSFPECSKPSPVPVETKKIDEKPKAVLEISKPSPVDTEKVDKKSEIVPEVPKPSPFESKNSEEKSKAFPEVPKSPLMAPEKVKERSKSVPEGPQKPIKKPVTPNLFSPDNESFETAPSIPDDSFLSPQSDIFLTPNSTTVFRSFIDELPPDDDFTSQGFDDFDPSYNQEENDNFEQNKPPMAVDPFLFSEEPPELSVPEEKDEDKVDNSKVEVKAESFKNKFKMFEPKPEEPAEVSQKEAVKPTPKKLNVNLKINVGALLPGAKRPKKPEEELEEKLNKIFPNVEEKKEPEAVVGTPAKTSAATTEAENPNLLVSLNKNRVKGPNTRKPSTRKARVQSYHESTTKVDPPTEDFVTNTEVKAKEPPLSVAEMLRTAKLKDSQLSRRSLNFDEIDEFKVPAKKEEKVEEKKPEMPLEKEKEVRKLEKPLEKEKFEPKMTQKSPEMKKVEPKDVKKPEKPLEKKKIEPKVVQKPLEKKTPAPKVTQKLPETKKVEPKMVKNPLEKEKPEPRVTAKIPETKKVEPKMVQNPLETKKVEPKMVQNPLETKKVEPKEVKQVEKPLEKKEIQPKTVENPLEKLLPEHKVASKPVEPPSFPTKVSPNRKPLLFDDDDNEDPFSVPPSSASAIQTKPQPSNPAKEEKKKVSMFDSDSDDDLFSTKTTKSQIPAYTKEIQAKIEPLPKKDPPAKNPQKLFDDSEDEDLFSSKSTKTLTNKQPEKPSKSLFGDDDDGDDLFGTSTKVVQKKLSKPGESLFGDESDDDSLFGTASSKGKTSKSTAAKSESKPNQGAMKTSSVGNDPLADLLK